MDFVCSLVDGTCLDIVQWNTNRLNILPFPRVNIECLLSSLLLLKMVLKCEEKWIFLALGAISVSAPGAILVLISTHKIGLYSTQ